MTATVEAARSAARALPQRVTVLDIAVIEPHPANIRESLGDLDELARSIREQGILQPLLVQPHPSRPGRFRLLAGHRRFDAAQLAGLTAVPVIVRDGVDENAALELMLVENCQRRELNAMERAEALGALLHRGYSQPDIARRTGMSVSWVNYYVALLDLDDASRELVRSGDLAVTKAITAIRQTRARTRKKAGSKADFSWEPDHFTTNHPLAKRARAYCDAREHTMRRRLGSVACGQCWETAIRLDERRVIEAEDADADDATAAAATRDGA